LNALIFLTQLALKQEIVTCCVVVVLVVYYVFLKLGRIHPELVQLRGDGWFEGDCRETLDYAVDDWDSVVYAEFVISDLVDCASRQGVDVQDQPQHARQILAHMVWQFVVALLDEFEELSGVRVVEGKEPATHRVEHNSQTPDVDLERVVRLSAEHFRRCIAWTSTRSAEHFSPGIDIAESEVNNFDVILKIQKYIFRLEVSMDDPDLVQILNCVEQLLEILTGLEFSEFLILDDVFEELPAACVLSDQVIVMVVF
jgi:hypothetical protein